MSDNLEGMDAIWRLMSDMPDAVREEMGDELKDIGSQALALQLALVRVRTGALAKALDFTVNLQALRLRAGMTNLKGNRKLWYAILQEYGVAAGSKKVFRRRRVNGKLRLSRRRKRLQDIVTSYDLAWRSRPGQPFVHIEDRVDTIADQQLGDFWDRVLARAGG